jgi:hypothetical protein
MGSPQRCEIFIEAVPMYPEAAIKASFLKNLCDYMVKIANKVSFTFDGIQTPESKAMNGGMLLGPSLIG